MKNIMHNIGLWAFGGGIVAGGVFMVSMLGYFAIVVAPYFFRHGDYVPAILTGIICLILFGGILTAVTSDAESSK